MTATRKTLPSPDFPQEKHLDIYNVWLDLLMGRSADGGVFTYAGAQQAGGEIAEGEGGGTDSKELGHGTGNYCHCRQKTRSPAFSRQLPCSCNHLNC